MKKILVLSLTSLISGLVRGTITKEQLDTGIYFLGGPLVEELVSCDTESLSPLHPIYTLVEGAEARSAMHQMLFQAFLRAESEDRFGLMGDRENSLGGDLNELLAKNGLPEPLMCGQRFAHHLVASGFVSVGVEIDVVMMGRV